jgi:O-antigen/teichoic acid export membrane protein
MILSKQDKIESTNIKNELADLYKNIGWGVIASLLQNFLYSIFFIVVARQYETRDFSNYIISNNLYGFVLTFSSLGLGQWFLREIQHNKNKNHLQYKFLKSQIVIGIGFYFINLLLCSMIYKNDVLLILSIILGINIILDNIISVFKFINIDGGAQHKTFTFLSIEAILKFLLALLLIQYKFNIVILCSIIVLIKLFSVVLFLKYGLYSKLNLIDTIKHRLNIGELNNLIRKNISFAIIAGISVIFWSLGNIIVSKFLTINDIAYYDIVFKVFVMAQIIPVIFSSTVFPKLVKAANKDLAELKDLIGKYYYMYFIYGITAYVFVYSYAEIFIPLFFGSKYFVAAAYCKEMFLTMIVFPIVLLQANIMIAIKKEKIDMWMNIIVLGINIIICLTGVLFMKNLSIINYSIFSSFIIFMVMQDIYLIKMKIQELNQIMKKYAVVITLLILSNLPLRYLNAIWIFPGYLVFIGIILLSLHRNIFQLNRIELTGDKIPN